uniref:Vitellogenin domain-containing protein n=1 Tax=Anopheles culicifacies TaxID=139723 RepID=A0A182MV87_9DIPT
MSHVRIETSISGSEKHVNAIYKTPKIGSSCSSNVWLPLLVTSCVPVLFVPIAESAFAANVTVIPASKENIASVTSVQSAIDGTICGGPDHGICTCGTCSCFDSWSGDNCECTTDTSGCKAPSNDALCSGHGDCSCGRCICDKSFYGPFCETKDGEQPALCSSYEDCIRCAVYEINDIPCQNLDKKCREKIGLYKVELIVTTEDFLNCTFRFNDEENVCDYKFSYAITTKGETLLKVQNFQCKEIDLIAAGLGIAVAIVVGDFGYVAPAFGDAFNVGTEETFAFSNNVQVGNAKNATVSFGYRAMATVIVGSVWGNEETKLLKIQIQKPKLVSIPDEHIGVIVGMESPFYAWWNLGLIREVYFATSDTIPVKNLKKGICALFQYQLLDGTYTEDDPSGQCEAKYISHSSTRYHKSKGNCQYDAKRMERHEYVLRSSLKTSRSTDYTVSTDGALQKVTSQDYVKYLLNAHDQIGAYYESIMQLNVQGSAQKTATVEGSSLEAIVEQLGLQRETLLTQEFKTPCKDNNCDSVISLFKQYKNSLSNGNVGKEVSATALVDMVLVARKATKEDLLRVLKAKSSTEIKGQLLDLLGAVQTVAAHEAAKSEFLNDSEDEDMFLGERYLQALAVATRPQKEIVEDLLQMAQTEHRNVKFYDSLIQSMTAVTRRYAQLEGNSYETEVVKKVVALLQEKLDECSNDSCKLKYIRGFQNLKCPKTVDNLFKLAQESTKAVSVAAMKALRSFSVYLWNDEYRAKFEDIFFQVSKRYDSSARTLALDILLDMKPDYDELSHLLQFLKSSDKAYEVKQYLLQKLRMIAEQCTDFAMMLKSVIENDPVLNNYHVLAPRGLSTALSRKFSTAPSFNASLTSLQEMSGGVLKRGIVDLTLDVDNEKTSLFTLGLYAGGMSSFVSSNDEDSNDVEEEDTTAGMELLVQGVAMRPLEFFNGKGELMGHVWSGTASEPTPAYQAITLLQDNEEQFASHNGVILTLRSTGAISIDLNGQVTMSLWGRNAQSKVEQNTGISMIGWLSLDTSFTTVNVQFSVEQEPQLHLTSALDFSGDPALCMQLMQPKSALKQRFAKTITLVGTSHRVLRKTSKTMKLNGLTHSLNRKNNDMCNLISKS